MEVSCGACQCKLGSPSSHRPLYGCAHHFGVLLSYLLPGISLSTRVPARRFGQFSDASCLFLQCISTPIASSHPSVRVPFLITTLFGWHIFLYLQRVPAVFLYHINVVFRSVSSGTTFTVFLFEIFSHLIDTPGDLPVFLDCRCGDFHRLTRLHLFVLLLLLVLPGGYGGLPAGGDDL